jgi:hypothetical protein
MKKAAKVLYHHRTTALPRSNAVVILKLAASLTLNLKLEFYKDIGATTS